MAIGVASELTVDPNNIARADLPAAIRLRQSLFTHDGQPASVGIVYRILSNFRFKVGSALTTAVTRVETVTGTQQNPTALSHQLVLAEGPDKPQQFAVISQTITEPNGHRLEDQVVILVNGGR